MAEQMTRAEHLAWAKQRALEYVDRGELQQALDSIISDTRKHPALFDFAWAEAVISQWMNGQLDTPEKMREFINNLE